MAKVTYNAKHVRPIEAVSIVDNMIHNENGDRLTTVYNINLRGKLLVNRGSPTSSGTYGYFGPGDCENIPETGISQTIWLESLITKRGALSSMFSEDYKQLVIGTVAGTADLTCYPKVLSVSVEESDNPQYWPFNISLECDNIFISGVPIQTTGNRVKSYSDSWDISFDDGNTSGTTGDNRVHTVTHTISAQGLRTYNASGTQTYSSIDSAREYVQNRIGASAVIPTVCISGFGTYSNKYNYVDSHVVDVAGGSYSVSETWIYSTGNYLEEYTVESQTTNSKTCPTVSVNGTITGFSERSFADGTITTSKISNAQTFWGTLGASGVKARAEALSGAILYDDPVSTSVSIAPFPGTISYNYEFQGGPTKQLSNAVWENIAVSNKYGEDIYAVIPILGRGEIIQVINGGGYYKAQSTTLTIDAVYPCSTGIHPLGPRYTSGYSTEIQSVIDLYNPSGYGGVGSVVVESQSENWSAYDSAFNYSITWAWTYSGVCS
jgi:hypothetical protein